MYIPLFIREDNEKVKVKKGENIENVGHLIKVVGKDISETGDKNIEKKLKVNIIHLNEKNGMKDYRVEELQDVDHN